MDRRKLDTNFTGIIEKTRLIEEIAKNRDISLGEAYISIRNDFKSSSANDQLHLLNGALSQLVFEQTRNWSGDAQSRPGIAHIVGIVGVAENRKISLAEAVKIAIEENKNNEHWEAISWAIKFLGQKTE